MMHVVGRRLEGIKFLTGRFATNTEYTTSQTGAARDLGHCMKVGTVPQNPGRLITLLLKDSLVLLEIGRSSYAVHDQADMLLF